MNSAPMQPGVILCPICHQPLSLRLATGRKSGKSFVMLICSQDGRHFRAFINYRPFVEEVINHLETNQRNKSGEVN